MNWLQKLCSPILTDETGQPRTFYHGTDEKFDQFKKRPGKRYVLFSDFDVESPGHFFAEEEEVAQEYGRNVMKRQLNVEKILLDPRKYKHMSVDDFPPELEEELRYILAPMIEEDEYYGKFMDIGVSRYYIKDDYWIYNAIESEGLNWDVLDNPEVVNRMKELGYDATYVGEDEGRRSIFVLDNKQIIPLEEK